MKNCSFHERSTAELGRCGPSESDSVAFPCGLHPVGYPKQGVLDVVRRVLRFVEGVLRLFNVCLRLFNVF